MKHARRGLLANMLALAIVCAWSSMLVETACTSTPAPKPCSVALEAQYTAELVAACKDAGSVEACGDAGAGITARHQAAQIDAGCRDGK